MDAIVVGFYHDKKKEASKFHEVTETMMNNLLFAAMNEIKLDKPAPTPASPKAPAVEAAPVTKGSDVVVGEDTPGYMDIPAGASHFVAPFFIPPPSLFVLEASLLIYT